MPRKIEFATGSNIESVVYELLAANARGEQVYGEFEGHILYSDTVTMDSAYKEITGYTREEYYEIQAAIEEQRKKEEERKKRIEKYKQMVDSTRTPDQDVVIEMPTVIAGLKFIAENQNMSQEKLIQGLLVLGCNFTAEDIKKQFPNRNKLSDGMKNCTVAAGATLIVNIRDTEEGRIVCTERYLDPNNTASIYHFINNADASQSKSSNGQKMV